MSYQLQRVAEAGLGASVAAIPEGAAEVAFSVQIALEQEGAIVRQLAFSPVLARQ